MIYECKFCFYKTDRKSNFNKHLLSKNHILKALNNNKEKTNDIINNKSYVHEIDYNKKNDEKNDTEYCIKNHSSKNPPKSSKNPPNSSDSITLSGDEKRNEKDTICEYCGNVFTRTDSLKKHYSRCKSKIIYDEDMKKDREYMKKELERKDREIRELKDMANSAGNLMHKQMNATLIYLNRVHPNAPALLPITELDFQNYYLSESKLKEIEDLTIDYNDEMDDKEIEEKEERLKDEKEILKKVEIGEIMTFLHFNKRFLPEMIQLICNIYRKNDPDQQSVWVSDVSRKSYYINDSIQNEQEIQNQVEKDLIKSGWIFDPKGTEFKSRTIEPLMSFIQDYAETYHDSLVEKLRQCDRNKSIDPVKIAIEIGNVSGLIKDIKEKKFEKDITAEITPKFHLRKLSL